MDMQNYKIIINFYMNIHHVIFISTDVLCFVNATDCMNMQCIAPLGNSCSRGCFLSFFSVTDNIIKVCLFLASLAILPRYIYMYI